MLSDRLKMTYKRGIFMSGHFSESVIVYCFMAGLFFNFAGVPVFAADVETTISAILIEMKDKDTNVRREAIWKIVRTDLTKQPVNSRDEAIAGLKNLLKDPEKSVRYQAADVLAGLDHPCKEAIPVLIEALEEDDDVANVWTNAQF